MQRRTALSALTAIGAALASGQAWADWPERPIKFIVPYPPGGIGDSTARAISERMSKHLNQTMVVDNRPGGNQIPASQALAKSAADGYTLLMGNLSNMAINPASGRSLPYDARKDFAPVSLLFQAPLFLVIDARLPVQNLADLIALAKAQPGKLAFGSIGMGSSVHLAGELFNSLAKVETLHVPYKGSAPAITDLLGGQIQMMFDGGTSSLPHVKSGKLKVLAITAAKRSAQLPDLPTMEEAGLKGYVFTSWWGLVAPAGTPAAVIRQLSTAWTKTAADPELQQTFAKDGIEFITSTPEQFSAFAQKETERMALLIQSNKIVLD